MTARIDDPLARRTPPVQAAAEPSTAELRAALARCEERHRDDMHHLRNTLAVIRAMARRTGDETRSVADYAARLDGRLAAYIQAQAAIARDGQADFETLAADELLRFGLRIGEDATLGGPTVTLSRHAGGLVALLLHELAGAHALHDADEAASSPLEVTWRRGDDGALAMAWRTRAGGPATPWPLWLEQAIEHQLSGTLSASADDGETVVSLVLPASSCRGH